MSIERNKIIGLIAFTAVIFSSSLARAEVMDKEVSAPGLWLLGSAIGGAGLLLWRFFGFWGLLSVALGMLYGISLFSEITDPSVGPGIAEETGGWYVWHFAGSLLMIAALNAVGFVLWTKTRSVMSEDRSRSCAKAV